MAGEVNFKYGDIYGGYNGTTETTIPEADDQTALVDDQKSAESVSEAGKKKLPILAAVALIGVLAVVLGMVRK